MRKPRGPTGSVRGLPPSLIDDVLAQLVEALVEKANDGRTFVRHQAAQLVRDIWELDEGRVEGIVYALTSMPGVESVGGGVYRLPEHAPETWARNRNWRYSLGRIRLDDAAQLYLMFLETDQEYLTPNMRRHFRRLRNALAGVFDDEYIPPLMLDENNE